MAHAVVEWTDNLAAEGFAIRPLLELIARAMREADGIFPWGGIRIRGLCLSDYVIADDNGEDAFINISVKMGAGRDPIWKAKFFGELFEQIKANLAELFDRRYLALSLYVEEADERGSFKHNNLHTRFSRTD